MTKKRKIGLISITVIVILLIVIVSVVMNRNSGINEEDLEESFYQTFSGEQYDGISNAEHNGYAAYFGYREQEGEGDYVIFQKKELSDKWEICEEGTMDIGAENAFRRRGSWGRMYLSLNTAGIVKVTVRQGDQSMEYTVSADKPCVVLADEDIDNITFITEDGRELSEEAFLQGKW